MGRTVRHVPADWQHPRNDRGQFIPLLEGNPAEDIAEWEEGAAQWQKGLKRFRSIYPWEPVETDDGTYEEWAGTRPDPADYMPVWTPEQATHFMMYENTSEGTPISPAFATKEELARWLTDTGASWFAGMTTSYDNWMRMMENSAASLPMFVVKERAQ